MSGSGAWRVFAVLAVALASPHAVAAQAPEPASAPAPAEVLDVAPFERVLSRHVRAGRVDYAALAGDAAGRADLTGFLDAAAGMPDDAPLASWLNVYNAFVIELVLRHRPIEGVMAVDGFFKRFTRRIAGAERSLDALENALIRPRFRDARVHMALNCGARSCPPLPARAFRQAELDAQLDACVRTTLAEPRHVRLEGGRLRLSALFYWYEADFVREAGSVVAWIRKHAPPGPLRSLADDVPRSQLPYDWSLNGTH